MLLDLAAADGRCGAKAATLGALLRGGFPVAPGVVLTDVPDDDAWPTALPAALRRLGAVPFAVRSSALGEDGADASFAGQLETVLDVPVDDVAAAVRRVAASGGAERLAAYAARTGRRAPTAVPVLVQAMVRAEVSGVLFTRDPVTGADRTVVEAHRGPGHLLVDGTVTPTRWTVDDGAVGMTGSGTTVLDDARVRALAELGRRIETALGRPQDVEWAIADGVTWVLQSRPITTARRPATTSDGAHDGVVLVTGTPASTGVARGEAGVVRGLDDFATFPAGGVLVCRATSPAWTPLLARAAAVVTETGGVLAHAAIVAREFGIPAVTGAEGATRLLTPGRAVVVDGGRGRVSAG